jgi:hypothetical protein
MQSPKGSSVGFRRRRGEDSGEAKKGGEGIDEIGGEIA